jgi:hypothetical protein
MAAMRIIGLSCACEVDVWSQPFASRLASLATHQCLLQSLQNWSSAEYCVSVCIASESDVVQHIKRLDNPSQHLITAK